MERVIQIAMIHKKIFTQTQETFKTESIYGNFEFDCVV